MALTKCSNCGCEDSFLNSPAPCPTPAACPTPEPCYTVTDSQCTIYTGLDIECGSDVIVESNTNMAVALNNITDYFCTSVQSLQAAQGLFDTGFRGSLNPTINVNTVTASLANSSIGNGVTVIIPTGDIEYQIVDGVTTTQYNTSTGVWTCPQTGRYDINYNVYLTAPSQSGFGWGDTPTPTGGIYSIGVTNTAGSAIYCADTFTVTKGLYYSRIYLTGGLQGVTLTAGTQIVLKHQNMTGINYTGVSGDNIDLSIRRVG